MNKVGLLLCYLVILLTVSIFIVAFSISIRTGIGVVLLFTSINLMIFSSLFKEDV